MVTGDAGRVHVVPVRSIDAIVCDVTTEVPQSVASFCIISHWRMRSMSGDEGSTAAKASRIIAVEPMRPIDHHDCESSDGHHMPLSGDVTANSRSDATARRAASVCPCALNIRAAIALAPAFMSRHDFRSDATVRDVSATHSPGRSVSGYIERMYTYVSSVESRCLRAYSATLLSI